MSSKPKILVNLVKKTLERKGIDYEKEINNFGQIQAVKSRIDDKIFSLKEHIKGLVYSLLSKQRIWKSLVPNIKKIDSIFYFYNPEKLISVDPKRLIEKIVEIKCGNMLIKKQILTLKDNIKILKRLHSYIEMKILYMSKDFTLRTIHQVTNIHIFYLQ